MARGKEKKGAQKTITSTGFFPLLPKPAVAVGKFASVPGKYWTGCPPVGAGQSFEGLLSNFAKPFRCNHHLISSKLRKKRVG